MFFEWDHAKADANRRKHGVSFEEAATVFEDLQAIEGVDPLHSDDEPRALRVGFSNAGRLLVVAFTIRGHEYGETIRIISARPATPRERTAFARRHD